MAKVKDKERKDSKKKTASHIKGALIRLSADFLAETLQARGEWHDIFKVLKEKTLTTQENSTQQGYYLELKER